MKRLINDSFAVVDDTLDGILVKTSIARDDVASAPRAEKACRRGVAGIEGGSS